MNKELPCKDVYNDMKPLVDICSAVQELKRLKYYFLKEGEITCISCHLGPFTSKTIKTCIKCKDFNKWEPPLDNPPGNNCNTCDNVECDDYGPICGECKVINPEKSLSKWQKTK